MISGLSSLILRLLLPYRCRYAGFILFILGIASACLFFLLNIKPEWLNIKVFALFSYYFEEKYFSFISNNISEEISLLFLLSGLFMLSFSKLRNETDETLLLRVRSLLIAIYINTLILLLSTLFVYGLGFMMILIANCFSGMLIHTIVFQIYLLKRRKLSREHESY